MPPVADSDGRWGARNASSRESVHRQIDEMIEYDDVH
jgi:hypothetical protein